MIYFLILCNCLIEINTTLLFHQILWFYFTVWFQHDSILTISQRIIHRSSYSIGIDILSLQSSSSNMKILTDNPFIQCLCSTGERAHKKTERCFRSVFLLSLIAYFFLLLSQPYQLSYGYSWFLHDELYHDELLRFFR